MRLNHNLASLNIFKEQTKSVKAQTGALNRISSGNKINNSSDNPNAIAQSERMRMQIRGLQMAQRNSQDGMSMLQSAEGGLDSITSMLQRIRELAVKAGGANTMEDNLTIQKEIEQMRQGIDDISNNTEFNGVKLLRNETVVSNASPEYVSMATGANVDERVQIPKYNISTSRLGIPSEGKYLSNVDITKAGGIDEALKIIDSSLNTLLSVSSKYGALENRFESSFNISTEIADTIQIAESSIRDADVAEEMMNYSRFGILIEASNAMMAQSNKLPQDILRILDNIR